MKRFLCWLFGICTHQVISDKGRFVMCTHCGYQWDKTVLTGTDEPDLTMEEQVALNAGKCLAWNCDEDAGKEGYCPKHV